MKNNINKNQLNTQSKSKQQKSAVADDDDDSHEVADEESIIQPMRMSYTSVTSDLVRNSNNIRKMDIDKSQIPSYNSLNQQQNSDTPFINTHSNSFISGYLEKRNQILSQVSGPGFQSYHPQSDCSNMDNNHNSNNNGGGTLTQSYLSLFGDRNPGYIQPFVKVKLNFLDTFKSLQGCEEGHNFSQIVKEFCEKSEKKLTFALDLVASLTQKDQYMKETYEQIAAKADQLEKQINHCNESQTRQSITSSPQIFTKLIERGNLIGGDLVSEIQKCKNSIQNCQPNDYILPVSEKQEDVWKNNCAVFSQIQKQISERYRLISSDYISKINQFNFEQNSCLKSFKQNYQHYQRVDEISNLKFLIHSQNGDSDSKKDFNAIQLFLGFAKFVAAYFETQLKEILLKVIKLHEKWIQIALKLLMELQRTHNKCTKSFSDSYQDFKELYAEECSQRIKGLFWGIDMKMPNLLAEVFSKVKMPYLANQSENDLAVEKVLNVYVQFTQSLTATENFLDAKNEGLTFFQKQAEEPYQFLKNKIQLYLQNIQIEVEIVYFVKVFSQMETKVNDLEKQAEKIRINAAQIAEHQDEALLNGEENVAIRNDDDQEEKGSLQFYQLHNQIFAFQLELTGIVKSLGLETVKENLPLLPPQFLKMNERVKSVNQKLEDIKATIQDFIEEISSNKFQDLFSTIREGKSVVSKIETMQNDQKIQQDATALKTCDKQLNQVISNVKKINKKYKDIPDRYRKQIQTLCDEITEKRSIFQIIQAVFTVSELISTENVQKIIASQKIYEQEEQQQQVSSDGEIKPNNNKETKNMIICLTLEDRNVNNIGQFLNQITAIQKIISKKGKLKCITSKQLSSSASNFYEILLEMVDIFHLIHQNYIQLNEIILQGQTKQIDIIQSMKELEMEIKNTFLEYQTNPTKGNRIVKYQKEIDSGLQIYMQSNSQWWNNREAMAENDAKIGSIQQRKIEIKRFIGETSITLKTILKGGYISTFQKEVEKSSDIFINADIEYSEMVQEIEKELREMEIYQKNSVSSQKEWQILIKEYCILQEKMDYLGRVAEQIFLIFGDTQLAFSGKYNNSEGYHEFLQCLKQIAKRFQSNLDVKGQSSQIKIEQKQQQQQQKKKVLFKELESLNESIIMTSRSCLVIIDFFYTNFRTFSHFKTEFEKLNYTIDIDSQECLQQLDSCITFRDGFQTQMKSKQLLKNLEYLKNECGIMFTLFQGYQERYANEIENFFKDFEDSSVYKGILTYIGDESLPDSLRFEPQPTILNPIQEHFISFVEGFHGRDKDSVRNVLLQMEKTEIPILFETFKVYKHNMGVVQALYKKISIKNPNAHMTQFTGLQGQINQLELDSWVNLTKGIQNIISSYFAQINQQSKNTQIDRDKFNEMFVELQHGISEEKPTEILQALKNIWETDCHLSGY